jgi:MFS family permease
MNSSARHSATLSSTPEGSHAPPLPPAAVLSGLGLCMLLPSLAGSMATVALPDLATKLSAPFSAVQWVVVAYLVATTAAVVVAGWLGDRLGRRQVLLGGAALFTAASAACALAPSLWALVAARAAQGVGAAVMTALSLALVGEAVPKARTGSAMGLLGTLSAVGTALGPALGGLLLAGWGWRAIFGGLVPLGLVAVILVVRTLPADLAASRSGQAAEPLPRAGLRHPGLKTALLMSALATTVVMSTLMVGPFYLSQGLGLGAGWVGLAMSVGPAVAALTGLPAGRAVDRFGAPPMAMGGLAAMVAGCAGLASAPLAVGVVGYVLPLGLATAGYALFQAANNTAVMAEVPAGQRGTVSGLLALARNLGLIAGAWAMGAVFAAAVGTGDVLSAPPEAVAAGMRLTFGAAAALAALALAAAWRQRVTAAKRAPAHPGRLSR